MGRNNTIQVTNDGATILRSIGVDNPAAKVLVSKYPPDILAQFKIQYIQTHAFCCANSH